MESKGIFKTETLQMTTHHDGFWLYDKVLGMNLAMRAKTEREAFVEALEYYQRKLAESVDGLRCLTKKVRSFVQTMHDECEITPDIEDTDQW